jgi:disulfide bond formation protein DsbB
MDVDAVQTFTSVLAIAAAALALAVLAMSALRRRSSSVDAVAASLDDAALWLAFLVAAGATAGSLYFSEVANYVPCRLCWFQRICMYPLSAVLLIAAIRRDRSVRWYALPLAGVGVVLSSYHYAIEWRPSLERGACGIGPESCTTIWFREFGFVTLPFMALCGFVAIIALLVTLPGQRELAAPAERPEEQAYQPAGDGVGSA